MAWWSGWIATALMLAAALVQLAHRIVHGKRAELSSRTIQFHFMVGLAAALVGFLHPLTAINDLGSPEAVGGGVAALGFGGVAFLVLLAHTGLGLKLRDPKLRRRPKARRAHVTTAVVILVAVGGHVAACILGARP